MTYLAESEYRYIQAVPTHQDRNRYPAVRVPEHYLRKLLINPAGVGLQPWSLDLGDAWSGKRIRVNEPLLAALEQRRRSGATSPPIHWEAVAWLLTNHLGHSGEYTYSLNVRRQELVLDPVLDFLVNVKQGPCERYATALTLALRRWACRRRSSRAITEGNTRAKGRTRCATAPRTPGWRRWRPARTGSGRVQLGLVLDPTPAVEAVPTTSALERWQLNGKALFKLILGYTAEERADLDNRQPADCSRLPLLWLGSGLALLLVVGLVRRRAGRRPVGPATAGTWVLYGRLLGRCWIATPGCVPSGRDASGIGRTSKGVSGAEPKDGRAGRRAGAGGDVVLRDPLWRPARVAAEALVGVRRQAGWTPLAAGLQRFHP